MKNFFNLKVIPHFHLSKQNGKDFAFRNNTAQGLLDELQIIKIGVKLLKIS